MQDSEKLARAFEKLHPFEGTAREVFSNAELTEAEQTKALEMIPLTCPWFSPVIYARACHAAGQVISARKESAT